MRRLRRNRDWLCIAVAVCAICDLLLNASRANLPDLVALFAAVPLAGLTLGVFAFFGRRTAIGARLWPFAIMAATVAAVWLVPLYRIGVEYEFWKYGADRAQIVRNIEAVKLTPVSRPGFPLRYAVSMAGLSDVSAGACGAPQGVCVEFVEFPGFLGDYSGFLFVPDGGEPRKYVDGNPAFIARHLYGNWFFVTQK